MAHPASPRARAFTRALLASTALVELGIGSVPLRAEPLPTGGQVVSGGVTIGTPQGGALAITQSSQTAIVNWQGFSVGQNNRVDIRQPNANAAILNRVTGTTRSTIAGQLNANGQVYLVNPNGVTITRSGQVNAAGFVASSLGITDEDFRAGRRQFRGSGASAPVTNHGAITIGRGGYAALIGGSVNNAGTISVPMGRVGLGSGERATLDLSGDGFLQVAVPTQAKGRGALVRHSGTISADGGSVTLAAAAARDMARQAVNLSGVVEARAVSGRNGSITLSGGEGSVAVTSTARLDASGKGGETGGRVRIDGRRLDVAGTVDVSGAAGGRVRLNASGHLALSGRVLAEGRTGRGGRVVATAPTITTHAALVEASGATGGGVVRVGGGRMGRGSLARAERVAVDSGTTIRADALVRGDGGDVVVWSDVATRFAGTITARGGARGGDGGEAEVSSRGHLAYTGFTDLRAAHGALGTLLLDPYDITIANAADTNQAGFTATGNDSVINASTLLTALGSANVTVSTGAAGSAGAQAGNITVTAPLAWNTGATLTLEAAGSIAIGAAIDAPAGGLTLRAGANATATADLSVARFTLASGNWVQNATALPGFATADFRVTGGSFLRVAGGAGTGADPYRLADIYGVQGMGSSAAHRGGAYRLANDIDAAGTATWWGGWGFVPVGDGNASFTGSLDGAGHRITGLTVDRPSTNQVGLIGVLGSGGTVTNLGLEGGRIGGGSQVGGLVGFNKGTVNNAYATGAVTGNGGFLTMGGLVGNNSGTVSNAYATGAVTGNGGLPTMGGLVGNNSGTVSNAYATGAVTNNVGLSTMGGLVGNNSGTLTNTYWDTATTRQGATGVGGGSPAGATGLSTAQARTEAAYVGFDFSTVWYQAGDLRPMLRAQAAAPGADGVIPVSTLDQLQLMGADLSGRYRLTRDLDAGATASTDSSPGIWGAGGFVPVGDDSIRFTGSLDGAGHRITDLTIDRPSTNEVGLIGSLGGGGTVTGLGLVGGSVSGNLHVGWLVGTNRGTVSNAYATGAVNGSSGIVGGLVGLNTNFGTVSNAYATGAVTSNGNNVGGLVGYNTNFGTVSNAYATGTVTGRDYVGGLVGYNTNLGTMRNAYATGTVNGNGSQVGGLVGNNAGTLTNTYWDTATTGQGARGVGAGITAGATGLSTAQARTRAAYAGFDFDTVWYQAGDLRPMLRAQAATAGADGVIPVSTLAQLQLMRANLSGRYRLTRDLDAGATASTDASPGVFGAGGFVPMGDDNISTRFTGSLDGAGHTITGLTIARPSTDYVGLIGYLGGSGTVTDLGLEGGRIAGRSSVGGLVGSNGGRVSNAYATGAVIGSGNNVGGLVGWNSGTVNDAYATGAVIGNYQVGGLVGGNIGTVSNTYATGAVNGGNSVGGLVGTNGGPVSNAYATGAVIGSGSSVGGLVGYNLRTLTNTYWDTATTGRSVGVGGGSPAGTTGLTTAQMQDLSSYATTYAGFDFATVWAPPNQAGQGGQADAAYPQLYALSRVVTVTPGASSRAYGDANPVLAYHGLRPGAFVTSLGTLTTTATVASAVGIYAYTVGGTAVTAPGGTYRILSVPGTLAVTPRAVTVTADARSRVYGDANPVLTYTVSGRGLVNGDTLTGGLTTAAGATSRVAAYAIEQGTLAASANYALTYVGADLRVGQRAVTVTADARGRVYGDTNPALTYTTTALGAGAALSGGLTTTATAASDVGSYAITQGSLTAAANPNYALSFVGANLTVGRRAVTVTADAQSRVYGDANPALTYTTTALGAGAALSGGLTTTATAASDVGSYAITRGSLTAAANPNYALSFVGANLTVGRRAVTVTADAQSRVYGDANPALTYTTTALGAGAALSGGLATTATASSDVGIYAIDQGSLTAAANPNYALSFVGANLTVGQRAVTVTADAQSRVYGDANPALTYTTTALGAGAALSGGLTTTATAASDVGSYAITRGSLTAAANPNYALSFVGANLTVGRRAVTVTADAQSRVYGDANPALTYTTTALGAGAALSGGLTTTATASSDVGRYAIDQGSLTAAANPNYALSFVGANLTVGQRAVTVTADAQNRVYGDANPALTYTTTALGAGAALSGGLTTTATAASDVGIYAIDQGSLTAAANPNYALSFVGANLTVGRRAVTVTADAQSRVYGDANPALTYTTTALGAGAALSGGLTTTATASSDVGRYAISRGALTAAANPNYALTFVGADLTVGQRAVTVTADAQNRVYGDANPALTYTTTALGAGAALSGGLTTTATAASDVGIYAIDQGSLTAAANPNYALSFVGANLTVGQRAVTVTADAQSRVYGDANPALTYTTTALGAGAALSGGLTTTATASSDVGRYAIDQGSLTAAANPNYALTFVGANLTVGQRAVTVTADAQSRVYGDANPALTYTTTALGAGAALSGGLTTTATASSDVGRYAIDQGSLTAAANPNYALSFVGANLTVGQRAVTVTADAQSRVYGDANPTLTYTTTALGAGAALSGGLATTATASSDVGRYAIDQGSLTAAANPNYALSFVGANLTVGQRAVTVTADAQNRVYGDANPTLTYTITALGAGAALSGGLTTTATASSDVGIYAITQGSLTAAANPNYALSFVGANLTVGRRAVTVTADAQNRVYGDANPTLTYAVGGRGLVDGDRLTGGLVADADAASEIGRYAITQGSLAASANYALTYQGADLTITLRPVTLSGTRVYDASTGLAGGLLTVVNRVNGDAVTVAGLGTLAGRDAGLQTLSDVSGLALSNANYTLTGASGTVAITPATLTYTADAARRTYGAANPALGGTVTGFLGTDTLADATTGSARFTTTAGTGSNVGRYAVTGAGLAAGNYVFTQAAGNAAALTIDPAGLTVTGTRTYDATTGFRVGHLTVAGGVDGETLMLTAGSGVTASADAGLYADARLTGLSLAVAGGNGAAANYRLPTTATLAVTPATIGLRVNDGGSVYGDRPVDPGLSATGLVGGQSVDVLTGLSAGFTLDAASAAGTYGLTVAGRLTNGNYRIGAIEAGTYTIDRRPITVAADALTRIYGDADPALTYTVGGRGLVNSDRLTGAPATAAERRSDVGTYAIGRGTLASSADYALTYRGADLTITARPITVFADPQTRLAGTANPSLTYRIGGRGLVAGDRLTGGLATTAEADSEPGPYRITQGSLTVSANYSLGFVGADLTVLPAPTQPKPRPVSLDPSGLASTAERSARRDTRPAATDLPLLLGVGPDGKLVAADPRFDATLVCAAGQGGCFLTPLPPAPMPAAILAPTPQASLPASAR